METQIQGLLTDENVGLNKQVWPVVAGLFILGQSDESPTALSIKTPP